MASRKYAALPDLDSAPDVYETPSLTDDNGTTAYHGTTERSGSDGDSDFGTATSGQSAPGSPRISRSRLHPDAARTLFEPARTDATDVYSTDRIRQIRRSYRASYRRLRDGDGNGDGKEPSDDEEETLDFRIARLKMEIEEVKQMARKKHEEETKGEGKEGDGDDGELCRMISQLEVEDREESFARLQCSLATPLPPFSLSQPNAETGVGVEQATHRVTYAQAFDPAPTIALTASFEARLNKLESALGIQSISLATTPPPPLLPTLNTLAKKLAMLTSMTPAHVDALSRRVRTLAAETEKLAAAKAAYRRGQTSTDTTDTTISSDAEGAQAAAGNNGWANAAAQEQEAKINALYGTLDTIDRLAPLFPRILERLRTLRVIHCGAGSMHFEMEEALKKQALMAEEIEEWKKNLLKVEEAMQRTERVNAQNVVVVEGWVKDLEGRVEKLEK